MRFPKLLALPFLVALGILLLNDHFLKAEYHNTLTGKLSDFAGLFAFAWFWTALFPRKKLLIHLLVAAFFVWWKSPLSQFAIDGFNSLGVFQIGRVVDYTDLMALIVLPFSSILFDFENLHLQPSILRFPVALVSIFTFTSTSISHVSPTFEAPKTEAEIEQILQMHSIPFQIYYSVDTIKTRQIHSPYSLSILDSTSMTLISKIEELRFGKTKRIHLFLPVEKDTIEVVLTQIRAGKYDTSYPAKRNTPFQYVDSTKSYWQIDKTTTLRYANGVSEKVSFFHSGRKYRKVLEENFKPLAEEIGLKYFPYTITNFREKDIFTDTSQAISSTRIYKDSILFKKWIKWKENSSFPPSYNHIFNLMEEYEDR